MGYVYEAPEGTELGPDDEDGMRYELEQAEQSGFEGENIWDAAVEDPPHDFWDAKLGCVSPKVRTAPLPAHALVALKELHAKGEYLDVPFPDDGDKIIAEAKDD